MSDRPEPYNARVPALRMLCNLGWRFLSANACLDLRGATRHVILRPRIIEFLQTRRFDYKGTLHALSPGAIEQILRELTSLGLGDGLLAANERLYAKLAFGITVTEFMPDGKKHQPTIAVIDWADLAANRFDVTEDLRVLSSQGTHHRAPDIVGYVNGIPLVVVEATPPNGRGNGSSDAMVREGIGQHLRNQRDEEIPQLFVYAQLLLSISEADGRYGTTRTPARFWAKWNHEEEFDDARLHAVTNAHVCDATHAALLEGMPAATRARFESSWSQPREPNGQERLLASLLTPSRLLELLRSFVLFDRRAGKIVARHHQFFGVRALLNRLATLGPDGSREGGVVWHTTGSGKSFTMVFLTKALLLNARLKECRVMVVTDRVDLEHQLARNFMHGGAFGASPITQKEGERSKAVTGADLAKRIGRGTERITFALVQKFNTASRLPECRNDSPDVIVLIDEGHRSHGGETHERMRGALPRAACVAFTGTPLLKGEKTANRFGPIVHAYTMQRAVSDSTVVPLLYEERMPDVVIDARSAADRVELIAWDIATHFSENFKKTAPGLKGQIATASKRDAIRYKEALDVTGLVSSLVVISPPRTREGHMEADEIATHEVHDWWKQNVLGHGHDAARYERQALHDFATDGGPDLLIVVDRLLTGFDEPRNAVLYIDKPLKSHNLIQAVARVNRLHDAKQHGLLVDYRGILKELDTANHAYQDLETRTQGGFDVEDLEGLYARVDAHEAQTRRPVVWHSAGTEAREPPGLYVVHKLADTEAADEAAFEDPQEPYALLREFERRMDARAAPGLPDALAIDPQARAYFGAILLALGDEAAAGLDAAERSSYAAHALAISHDVQRAVAEHSLNPQSIEAAIRQSLLVRLHAPLGLDKAVEVIGHVLRIARADLRRQA